MNKQDHWNAAGKNALDAKNAAAFDEINCATSDLITITAAEHGVDESVVEQMAHGTITHLLRMYEGDVERLIADLQTENGLLILQAGIADYRKTYRRLVERALTHPGQFAAFVEGLLTDGEEINKRLGNRAA